MPRSLSKEGVRHPLNSENSEFSHSLGRKGPSSRVFKRQLWRIPNTVCQIRYKLLHVKHEESMLSLTPLLISYLKSHPSRLWLRET